MASVLACFCKKISGLAVHIYSHIPRLKPAVDNYITGKSKERERTPQSPPENKQPPPPPPRESQWWSLIRRTLHLPPPPPRPFRLPPPPLLRNSAESPPRQPPPLPKSPPQQPPPPRHFHSAAERSTAVLSDVNQVCGTLRQYTPFLNPLSTGKYEKQSGASLITSSQSWWERGKVAV